MMFLIILFLSYGFAFVLALRASLERTKPVGKYIGTMALVLFLPLIINVFMALIGGYFQFDGECHGFTDGKWDCSKWEYLLLQIDYAFLLTLFFNMIWFGMVFLMSITNLILRYLDTHRA